MRSRRPGILLRIRPWGNDPPMPDTSAADTGVAVVIATRNRADELLATLAHLTALPSRPVVVVVDNGSTDGSARRVEEAFPGVRVVALGENLGAAARNIGVELVDVPYVAFSDDDSWWAPEALSRAVDRFQAHPRVALIAARILVGEDERLDPTSADMIASPLSGSDGPPGPRLLGFLACGAVVRRDAFLAVGGFEPRLVIGGEEELLALDLAAAGHELRYVDEVVAHHHPSSVRDSRDRRRRLARNGLLVAWLRRPRRVAAARTAAAVREALRDRDAAAGLASAVAALPWALRNRRVVPAPVEADLRLLGH